MEVSVSVSVPVPAVQDQFSILDSWNLRDLLRVREEEDEVRRRESSVTLAKILADEKRKEISSSTSSSSSTAAGRSTRTLLDVIRDEDDARRRRLGDHGGVQRIKWKSFRDRLFLRRGLPPWPVAAVDAGSTNTHHGEVQTPPPSTYSGEPSLPPAGSLVLAEAGEEEEEPMRVSLMALLEQSDRTGSGDNLHETSVLAAAMIGMEVDDDEEVEGDEQEGERERGTSVNGGARKRRTPTSVCCVCMVRHKGAAFIPCGHTFCRLCSRELWVSRGSCPLCNGFILEILDIF